jgi:hypothetical protein
MMIKINKKRRLLFLTLSAMVIFQGLRAQEKYYTKTGTISFFSDAPLEKIKAINKNVTAIIDTKTGALQVSMLMKGFEFEKALMQEHFNENYVESEKYPKSEFGGLISNKNEISYSKDGSYAATVKGKLKIHGVQKEAEITGKIIVHNGTPSIDAVLSILLSDYNIKIPGIVEGKIANRVEINVNCTLESRLN